ncbi:MAG: tetratricopeptide repeat protein [Rhodospirillaceae bacterium]|nr:tetratricopeptide repeat protein [Rhodospirillaceae bacterium]
MDTTAELEKARALSRFGRHKAAAEICQRILERQPNRADALLILGSIAYDLGDSRAAVGFASRIVDRTPAHPGAAILFANALAKLGANDSALAWYRVALDIDGDKSAAAAGLARMLVAGGRLDEVAALAEMQLAAGRVPMALDVAQIGWEAAPGNAALAHVAGRALAAAGRTDEAASRMRIALLHAPQDPAALEAIGLALRDIAWLERALAVRSSADVLASLGDTLAAGGDAAAASGKFEAALALEGSHRRAAHGLARLHLEGGKADAVIGLARRRLAEASGDADAARLLGEALTRRGLAASALTYAQTAAKSGQREVAEAVADGIRAADPHHLGAWRMLRTARACRVILAHEPADAAAMVELGAFDPVSAEVWPERAIAFDGGPRTVLAIARTRLRKGDKEAA